MPLPNEKPNLYRVYNSGYVSIGTITDQINENRRRTGSVYTPKYDKIPFRKESLTTTDTALYGMNLADIKLKIGIDFNPTIYDYAVNKLIVKIGSVFYNIDKADVSGKTLILYLVTANQKGGQLNVIA